jgi:hypothetical protein
LFLASAFSAKAPGDGLADPVESWRAYHKELFGVDPVKEPLRDTRPGFEGKYRFVPDFMQLPGMPDELKKIMARIFGPNSYLADQTGAGKDNAWPVRDTIAAAFLIGEVTGNSVLASKDGSDKGSYSDRWLDVDDEYGPNFGRANGHIVAGPIGTQRVRVIKEIDADKFWKLIYAMRYWRESKTDLPLRPTRRYAS